MTRVLGVIVLSLVLASGAEASMPKSLRAVATSLPDRETDILLNVGREYELDATELKLLLVIRKIENGGAGIEMGVASDYPGHRARRFAGNPEQSLRVQARWAAGTIRKHYRGDLDAFARRYCPPKWQHWAGMARNWMDKP